MEDPEVQGQGGFTLKTWLWIVISLDSISLVLDARGVLKYRKGDTEPIYVWRQSNYASVDEAVDEAASRLEDHSESQHSTYSV